MQAELNQALRNNRNMLLLLLLLSASEIVVDQTVVLGTTPTCPILCSCVLDRTNKSLTIDCSDGLYWIGSRTDEITPNNIDELLDFYSNVTLQSITINNSPITKIPISICYGRAELINLNLDRNWLKTLSVECLKNKRVLKTLSVSCNNITSVEIALLKDLPKLNELDLSYNAIETIDSKTFTKTNNRPLWNISLAGNRLKTFGVWPFSQSRMKALVVDARNNLIEKIINDEEWYYGCNSTYLSLTFHLDGNKLQNAVDIFGTFCRRLIDLHCIFFNSYWNMRSIVPNSLRCDCRDFMFYTYMKSYLRDPTEFSHIECTNNYKKAIMLSPEEMTCEVEEQCPSGCKCINQPSNLTYHIICSGTRQRNLPVVVPNLNFPKSVFMPDILPKYKLYFANSNFVTIDTRPYFSSTDWIDLSNSNVHNITVDALKSMKYIKTIILNNNKITTLPEIIQGLNLTFEKLNLYGNPLLCNCENSWLRNWILDNPDRFQDSTCKKILCKFPRSLKGKSLMDLEDEDLCKTDKPLTIPLVLVLPTSIVIAFFLVLAVLLFCCRVQLFDKINIHPFDRDECEGEEMDYDIFISFAHCDSEIARSLLTFLEEQNSYKVCFHQRDFIGGSAIIENITTSINRSKRTLCLVSHSFISSSYCMEEFQISLNRDASLNKRRLIVLLLDDVMASLSSEVLIGRRLVSDSEVQRLFRASEHADEDGISLSHGIEQSLPEDNMLADDNANHFGREMMELGALSEYLNRHTYIELRRDTWKRQLLYSLPLSKLHYETSDRGQIGQISNMANIV